MMQFVFFNAADKPIFVRSDAEQAVWTVDEMNLVAVFPSRADMVLQRGQRVGFEDETGVFQPFEIRKVETMEPDHYQRITAEHIAISELTDEHYTGAELTNATAQTALAGLLTGTLWQVGNVTASGTQTADLSLGSVWQNVRTIEQNWNVYITPRVTFNTSGITGRYLDIAPAQGTWRGVRLSLDKNADDVGVVIDDTNVITAIYGYGAMTDGEPLDFSSVTWAQTADHPAKPAGQKYLEDPAATAAYGRNGRPRYGYYQNSDIDNAETLLQKAWESLKVNRTPSVTVNCTVRDLYRLGYRDQPIRLHDTALVQIRQTNTNLQLEIIKLTVDLLDPTATRPTIGAYIPNIVYMLRQTAQEATGGVASTASGARGTKRGGGGKSNRQNQISEFETEIRQNQYQISLRAYQRDLEHTDQIVAESSVTITSQGTQISALRTDVNSQGQRITTAESRITVNATSITSEVTDRTNADNVLSSRITQTATEITLKADKVTVDALQTSITNLTTGVTTASSLRVTNLVVGGNGCSWFTVNATNGIFKLLGTYD
jgi:phage minor structural protein